MNTFFAFVFVVLFTPATAGMAWYVTRKNPFNRFHLPLMGVSLIWGILVSRNLSLGNFFTLNHWLYALPAAPAASGALKGLYMLSHFLKPKSLQEQLSEQEQKAERERLRASSQAAGKNQAPVAKNWLTLGAAQKGDAFPEFLGLSYEHGFLFLHESILDQHLFLLGSTGAGKSETIKRLVQEILEKTDRHIYLVDGKGDEQLANDVRSLAYHYGRGEAPVFRLGFDQFGAVYDGLRGQATDVYNRLTALVGVQEAEGDAQYYADINRDLLQLVCFAGDEPPRSFEEVRARLDKDWLLDATWMMTPSTPRLRRR